MFRPALLTSYALNYAVGGQAVLGYRVFNLLLHIGCSVLVGALAFSVLGNREQSWLAGLLFLAHPTHAELINYISSRSDLLVSFSIMMVLFLVLRSGTTTWSSYAIYVLGLLTKSVAVVTPALLLVLSAVRGSDQWRRAIRRYWGYGALTAAYIAIIWANNFLANSVSKAPRGLDAQLLTQLKAIVYYPFLMLLPAKLNVEHQFSVTHSLELEPVLGIFLVLSVVVVTVKWSDGRLFAICGSWFVLCLLPASLVPLNILVSERRMYLASAGLIIAAAWCLGRVSPRSVGRMARAAILITCSLLVVQRNDVWASELSLWQDSVQKAPGMHRPRINLGLAFMKANRLDASIRELEKGLCIAPDFADGWVVMGEAYQKQGKTTMAVAAFQKALKHNSQLAGVHHNLGNLAFARGDFDVAMTFYSTALEINPLFVEARNNLGQSYEMASDWPAALAEYEQAVADSLYWVNTGDPVGGAWLNLAHAAERMGDAVRAAEAFRNAHQLLGSDQKYSAFAQQALEGSLTA